MHAVAQDPPADVVRRRTGIRSATMQRLGMLELSLREQKIYGLTEHGKAVLTEARGMQG
ncbi:hypothetical protein BN2476_520010 [Paraburkholderia piptadeniae]|uniref:Uncharacterized protein n=1 Tax=Paraburkholderia piptadeniae TaxID=1701573 RepID=A0A1N7SGQ3_9BURK|nr:hypothetical protein BN2476_520010 [Paraburkholderia piptadeniae]